jgi:hypothetical protein
MMAKERSRAGAGKVTAQTLLCETVKLDAMELFGIPPSDKGKFVLKARTRALQGTTVGASGLERAVSTRASRSSCWSAWFDQRSINSPWSWGSTIVAASAGSDGFASAKAPSNADQDAR